jgi:hypothetical protein
VHEKGQKKMNTTLMRMVIAGGFAGMAACAASGSDEPPAGDADLIDDLEDGDDAIYEENGRLGGWYTFNDETAGTQQPPGSGFVPTAGGAGDSAYAAATTGGGFTLWGAGMAFDLNNPEAVGQTGARGPYDTSVYRGIAFSAKGNADVRMAFETPGVTPVDRGGTCVPGPTEAEACDDTHGVAIALADEWREFEIPFSQLRQGGWGQPVELDLTQVVAIMFVVAQDVDFDFAVDDVRFYE